MKILVAEDNKTTSEFLRKGLIENDHSVDCVFDGWEALAYCMYNQCDLVILDRMMPGMDGLSVLKALRAAGNALPVILLTAMADVDDRVDGLTDASACIGVSDNGPGVAAEFRQRVLEPFYRLDASHNQPGSGLGLALVKAIAVRHGVTIELDDNEPGRRISIRFPPCQAGA
jgi:CheY-like chemotaxis protein